MKKFISLVMILMISLMSCSPAEVDVIDSSTGSTICNHQWKNATCTEPVTCVLCGETAGDAIGHQWANATYTTPKTCVICGKTEGSVAVRKCLLCDHEVSRSNTLYCTTHDCGEGSCPCPAKHVNCSWGYYCELHSCHYPGCLSFPRGSGNYCGAHGG